MLSAFTFSLALISFSIFEIATAQNQNETSQDKNGNDFADSSAAVAGNFTANFSVSVTDSDDKIITFEKVNSNVSITDRSENLEQPLLSNQKSEKIIEFNRPKNITTEPKMLEDFRPSPQLDTYFEYNKFPVKPVFPEPKMVRNYANANSEEKDYFIKGEVLPLENERPRNLNNFEPGYSAFGNGGFPNSGRSQNGLSRDVGGVNNNNAWSSQQSGNEINRKNTNGDTPWVSRVRFPTNPSINQSPYPFVPNTRQDPHINRNSFPDKVGLSPLYPPSNNYNNLPPPQNNNEYLPPAEAVRYPSSTNNLDTNNVGYLPPTPNYGFTDGGHMDTKNGYLPPSFGSSGTNKEFNFNKLVEVPQPYYSEVPNQYPQHHNTYEPSYNIMEKPSPEGQHKTYGGGMSYNPWKKILKLFATFIPIGLLISALTPTVITVTNVNDTSDMAATRYRSNEDSKKEVTNHIQSSLDYFDKLNENGCEYRVFCELLVNASHMPNSKQHVENLLDNFAKEEIDYKSRADELRKVFAAVRNHDCNSISCEFIKNPI